MLRLLILIIALGAGGGAAWIATQQTATAPDPAPVAAPPEPAIEMTSVLVAEMDLARSGEVTAEALRWQDWPVEAVPPSAIERKAQPGGLREATGQYATRPILTGEPIGQHLLAPTPGSYLAAMLSPGKRAVAIDANTQSTAGGFILPNDRVDVLYTTERGNDAPELRSRTILKGVRVLAIDQSTDQTTANTVLGRTATLELTEAQAEVVTAAQSSGTLSLSLRPMVETPGEPSMDAMEAPKRIRVGRGTSIEDITLN
ncbi:Flp pilus assembly protein CpaB [Roseovarius sp. D22-M7]|uniref:Flp pilus assembly protein CpaB n=1 Tax=Roseovarius sp. D22-M7 TaxID=3127116 RepID=UPI0030101A45